MHIDEKIREYHSLKKAISVATEKLEILNQQIKDELNPGSHNIAGYNVNITLRKKFEYDYSHLPNDIYSNCVREEIDPLLVEAAYLSEELNDEQMKLIRGEAKIIPSLSVEKVKNV